MSLIAGALMKTEEVKNIVDTVRELNQSYKETVGAVKGSVTELHMAKSLWRKHNQSRLVKLGLALIAFPDPTISDVVGGFLVAVGFLQAKMRRSTLHIEDVYKTFPEVIKELHIIRQETV